MSQTPKPPATKRCPSCGWTLYREWDQDDPQRSVYYCSNRGCEREEAA